MSVRKLVTFVFPGISGYYSLIFQRPVQKVLIKSGLKNLTCVKDVEDAIHIFSGEFH